MRKGVSQTSKWLCSSSLSGQAKKSWEESSFNFLPATSARAEKSERASLGSRAGLAWNAGDGKPLPCTPALANSIWRGPAAAPGCFEIPRPNRVAARGPDSGRRARSLQRPPHATPSPPALPARATEPGPRAFRGPPRRCRGCRGGAPSPATHLRARSRGRSEGCGAQASRARRLKLCCSRDGAVVTSSRRGWCGPGGDPAARAVARRALQPPAPPALRALGRGGKRTAVRLRPSGGGSFQPGRFRAEDVLDRGRWCWGSGAQNWSSKENKGWERRKRKFFCLVLRLENHLRKHGALCSFLLCFCFVCSK